jgi:hypothetical protein
MTCRADVLAAFDRLEQRHGRTTFDVAEVVREVTVAGSLYGESTIRTHVSSRMCVNAPDNHSATYADLERVDRGRYQRR